jgi:large subunit ribosomal protein L9
MAKRQEVLLVQDVLKLGNMGDLVRVPPGYARNYLYPYGMAIPAGAAHKRQIEVLREKAAKSEAEREAKAKGMSARMQGLVVQVAARVAHDDELFGSIGTREIVAALSAKGIVVDGKQVHLTDKLRKIGRFPIEVRLHKNVPVTITVEVVNSDPNALSLDETLAAVAAKREAEKAARKAAKTAPKEGEEGAAPAEAEGKPAEAKAEKPAKAEKAAKSEKPAKAEKGEKPAKTEKSDEKAEKQAKKKKG